MIRLYRKKDFNPLGMLGKCFVRHRLNANKLIYCLPAFTASVSPNFEPVLLVNNTEVVVVPNLTPPEEGGTTSAFLTPSFDEEQPSNVLSALKSLVSSVSSTVTRAVLPPAAASRTPVASSQNVATCETSLIWLENVCFSARVVPYSFVSHILDSDRPNITALLHQQTTVFVSRSLLGLHIPSDGQDGVVTFVSSAAKVASPLEKAAKVAAEAKVKQGPHTEKSSKTKHLDCECSIVRVFIVPTSWADFGFLHGTDTILVSDTLRRQLGLDFSSRIEFQSLSRRAGLLESITLHPVGKCVSA